MACKKPFFQKKNFKNLVDFESEGLARVQRESGPAANLLCRNYIVFSAAPATNFLRP